MTGKNSGRRQRTPRQPQSPQPEPAPLVVDPRALERTTADITRLLAEQEFESIEEAQQFLNDLLGGGGPVQREPETPLDRAQDLMYDAWDETNRRKRIRLARKALEISPDCADAYVLLAEEARTIHEARDLYEQGVQAGERALGPDAFEENAGMFWGLIETRPYMRARQGLADVLWQLGEHRAAIEHYSEILRLNPNDNQGVRYMLINLLLIENDLDAVGTLLKQYEDDVSANWRYSRALWLFSTKGAGRQANKALADAMEWNPFVVAFLVGVQEVPPSPPPYMQFRDESEAISYMYEGGLMAWVMNEEASVWLAKRMMASI